MSICYYVLNWLQNYDGRNDIFLTSWLFVNMPFIKEDKILIKDLFELKDYSVRHLVREFSRKS